MFTLLHNCFCGKRLFLWRRKWIWNILVVIANFSIYQIYDFQFFTKFIFFNYIFSSTKFEAEMLFIINNECNNFWTYNYWSNFRTMNPIYYSVFVELNETFPQPHRIDQVDQQKMHLTIILIYQCETRKNLNNFYFLIFFKFF